MPLSPATHGHHRSIKKEQQISIIPDTNKRPAGVDELVASTQQSSKRIPISPTTTSSSNRNDRHTPSSPKKKCPHPPTYVPDFDAFFFIKELKNALSTSFCDFPSWIGGVCDGEASPPALLASRNYTHYQPPPPKKKSRGGTIP